MEIYNEEWTRNYERRANAGIPGREGLYRVCKAFFRGLHADSRILVIGCGTGEELISLAQMLPHASFVGIDPAQPMLELCRKRVSSEGLSKRINLKSVSLENFIDGGDFDAATAILVSQHLADDHAAAEFFSTIAALLKPRGRFYSADVHIASGQDRDLMLALWTEQALMSGIESEAVEGMLARFATDLRPRDEATIVGFLRSAGFANILKPYSSLIYGAWAGDKGA